MSSKGEQLVEKLLKNNGICYRKEVSFSDLNSLNGHPLRFDFVLYDSIGAIVCAIEIDGEQHFHQVPFF